VTRNQGGDLARIGSGARAGAIGATVGKSLTSLAKIGEVDAGIDDFDLPGMGWKKNMGRGER
jgi:hypothetical protein